MQRCATSPLEGTAAGTPPVAPAAGAASPAPASPPSPWAASPPGEPAAGPAAALEGPGASALVPWHTPGGERGREAGGAAGEERRELRLARHPAVAAALGRGEGEAAATPRQGLAEDVVHAQSVLARLAAVESASRAQVQVGGQGCQLLARLGAVEAAAQGRAQETSAAWQILARLEAIETAARTGLGEAEAYEALVARVEAAEAAAESQARDATNAKQAIMARLETVEASIRQLQQQRQAVLSRVLRSAL